MKTSRGFTAVELIITLILGMLLLMTAYQLYSFVLNDSADTRIRAAASNLAYRFMREGSAAATNPCTTPAATNPPIPSTAGLPNDTVATVTITCPNYGAVTLPYVKSVITYAGGKTVIHATYVSVN